MPTRFNSGDGDWFRDQAKANWDSLTPNLDRLLTDVSPRLTEMIQGVVPIGGSHQRAAFAPLVVAGHAASAEALEAAAWAGLACELVHLGTLLHDDIVDENRSRRDAPATWVALGVPMAVLIGDLLIALGYRALVYIPNEPIRRVLTDRFSSAVQRCQRSQADELVMLQRRELPTVGWCETSTADKTGAFFEFGLFAGAVLSGADERGAARYGDVGRGLGVCFQIADDVDDGIWNVVAGMPGGDLWEGKPSWPIALAVHEATAWQTEYIRETLYVRREDKSIRSLVPLCEMLRELRAIPRSLAVYRRRRRSIIASIGLGDAVLHRLATSAFDAIDARMNLVSEQGLSTAEPKPGPSRN